MATSTTRGGKEGAAGKEQAASPRRVLLVELEEAVDAMREALCRALAEQIREADLARVEGALLRCGLTAAPLNAARAVLSALGVRANTHDDILASVRGALLAHCTADGSRPRAAFRAAFEANAESGGRLTFLTTLPAETAQSVLERWGMSGAAALHPVPESDHAFPTPELWRRAARETGGGAPAVALVACRPSCRAALLAGFRCVVAPDRFTSAQDFSGADAVLEGARISKSDWAEVL